MAFRPRRFVRNGPLRFAMGCINLVMLQRAARQAGAPVGAIYKMNGDGHWVIKWKKWHGR